MYIGTHFFQETCQLLQGEGKQSRKLSGAGCRPYTDCVYYLQTINLKCSQYYKLLKNTTQ